MFFIPLILLATSCATTSIIDDDDVYRSAAEKYKKGKYAEVIGQLGRFKSQNPYDRNATAAELLIADAQFALKQYDEALYAYQRFAQLHPSHERSAYVLFQIGKVYWTQAPKAINRDQDKTRKAMNVWRKLIKHYPNSKEATEAKALLTAGDKRIANSIAAVAGFYCAQGVYHSCAYRYLELAETFNQSNAYAKATSALEKVLQLKQKKPNDKSNIYLSSYSLSELQSYIDALKRKSKFD